MIVGLVCISIVGTVAIEESDSVSKAEIRVIKLDGAIGPAVAEYFISNIEQANDDGVELVITVLDTPGGLEAAMRDMIKAVLASEVPVANYVHPQGARAASAGTYLSYASHIAAMTPATNIGSSSPVTIGGGDADSPLEFPDLDPERESTDEPQDDAVDEEATTDQAEAEPTSTMGKKVLNDSIAYIKGLAELRGRNVEWAEETVREASNITASEALEINVIDYIAEDIDDLLMQIHGKSIKMSESTEKILDTANANIVHVEPDWRQQILMVISDPNVAYILILVGVYGFMFEFYGPGTFVGAVVGVISFLIAAYALQMLPVNYVGLALLALGILLMIAEAFATSFGLLALSGVVSFIVGSLLLFDDDMGEFRVSIYLVVGVAIATAGFVFWIMAAAIKARFRAPVTGKESLIDKQARVVKVTGNTLQVKVGGEIWNAHASTGGISAGSIVKITAVDGLLLQVTEER